MPKLNDSLTLSLNKIQAQIASAARSADRADNAIELLAVSKRQAAAKIREAYELGQIAFGENYVQEALEKQRLLADLAIEWHFIGPIQSNKTRLIAEHFSWVHSVDRLKIAERLSQQRSTNLPPLNICLQINIEQEATKSGLSETELFSIATAVANLPNMRLRGLMAIPAPRPNHDDQLRIFQQIEALFIELRHTLPQLDTLSMGMSNDMSAAIAAGSTMVRVGSAIFGSRPT